MKKCKKIMAALMAVTTIFTCCMTASATETVSTESAASAIETGTAIFLIWLGTFIILQIRMQTFGAVKKSILCTTIILLLLGFILVSLEVPTFFIKLVCVTAAGITMLVFIKKDKSYTENTGDASDDQCPEGGNNVCTEMPAYGKEKTVVIDCECGKLIWRMPMYISAVLCSLQLIIGDPGAEMSPEFWGEVERNLREWCGYSFDARYDPERAYRELDAAYEKWLAGTK